MRRTYTDSLANEEEEMKDEIAYDKWQEDLSLREREERAEEKFNNQNKKENGTKGLK